jgi:hypothetical protein
MEIIGSTSEDGLQVMPNMPNGDSMRRPRSSSTCTGRTMSCKSTETEDIHTLEQKLLSTQDGGNYSESKDLISEPSNRVSISTSMFKEVLILKEDTFNVMKLRMVRSINNGKLSMLRMLKRLRPRDLTKNSASISTDHST